MLKKIACSQVREGMYVAKLEGSWLKHPFWRGAFLVDSRADVDALLQSGIPELWIDTALGDDLEPLKVATIRVIDDIAVDEDEPDVRDHALPQRVTAAAAPPVPLHAEVRRARRIFARSKPLLQSMFAQARLGRSVDTVQARELLEEIAESLQRNPWALLSVVRLKRADDYTYLHSAAVGALMIGLARQLQMDREQELAAGLAGMLHDIGKASIPTEILNKPQALTESEFDLIKTHPRRGHELLVATSEVDGPILDACLHHHERLDGTGYPDMLSGEQISHICRMTTICDIYDATTSTRPYKDGWDPAEALRRMARWTPAHIDQSLFHHFVKMIGIYPVGSFVRLESGLLGVVADQNPGSLLQPTVRTILSTQSREFVEPQLLDLSSESCADRITGIEHPSHWGVRDPSIYLQQP